MKVFKNIVVYLLSMIFLLSLTASFEGTKIIDNQLTGLDLSNEKMKMAFYDQYDLMDQAGSDKPDRDGKQYAMGSSGDVVFYYQRLLRMLGHLDKEPNGSFDQDTKDAVVSYQKEKAIESNGTLDLATLDLLDSETPAYQPNQEGLEILQYKEILYYMDRLTVKPDGIFDTTTETAIRTYQQEKGLEVNGLLDLETMDALYREPLTYRPGKEGEPIRLLQEKLIFLEYLTGVADGKFGAMTTDAITRFQKDQNIEQTGVLDPETVKALNQQVNVTP